MTCCHDFSLSFSFNQSFWLIWNIWFCFSFETYFWLLNSDWKSQKKKETIVCKRKMNKDLFVESFLFELMCVRRKTLNFWKKLYFKIQSCLFVCSTGTHGTTIRVLHKVKKPNLRTAQRITALHSQWPFEGPRPLLLRENKFLSKVADRNSLRVCGIQILLEML